MIRLYDKRETARRSNARRPLTRPSVCAGRGLAVKATRTCTIEDCGRPNYGSGLCYRHWGQLWRASRPPCSIEGCDKPRSARGWCITHYSRWRTTGAPGGAELLRRQGKTEGCAVPGCDQPYEGLGYCKRHRERLKRNGDPVVSRVHRRGVCSVDWCQEPHRCGGYCATHYERAVRLGDPLASVRGYGRTACEVEGCGRPHEALGYCTRHHRRLRLYGDPLANRPRGPREALRGALNPAWKGTGAGYRAAHDRIWRERGKASAHPCLRCGHQAAEWAYMHSDPDEVYAPGKGFYSLSPRFYEPHCVPCHRAYDAAWWAQHYASLTQGGGHD